MIETFPKSSIDLLFCLVHAYCADHMTDLPSVVSGSKIAFFDPHQRYLKKKGDRRAPPGSSIDFVKKQTAIAAPAHVDQFSPFLAFGCDMRHPFDGSLFRFPLRTQQQSKKSNLSEVVYSDAKVNTLFCEFKERAASFLMFLQKVERVELYVWEEGDENPRRCFSSGLQGMADSENQLEIRQARQVLSSLSDENSISKEKKTSVLLTVEDQMADEAPTCSIWRVVQLMPKDGCPLKTLARASKVKRLGDTMIPWGGVAMCMDHTIDGPPSACLAV